MLQGRWKLVSGEQDGVAIPQDSLNLSELHITGNRHKVTWADATLEGTHQLDTDSQPMTIDSDDTAGPFQGMSLKGIFKVEDDHFTVCFASPDKPRPTEFTTQDGKATILHVWQRTS